MLKLLGAAALILASGAWGITSARNLSLRRKTLEDAAITGEMILASLKWSSPTPQECFDGRSGIFGAAALEMERGTPPGEAIMLAAKKTPELTMRDIEAFSLLAQSLSAQNADETVAGASLFVERIRSLAFAAAKDEKEKSRLYAAGGILAGLAVAIVLM